MQSAPTPFCRARYSPLTFRYATAASFASANQYHIYKSPHQGLVLLDRRCSIPRACSSQRAPGNRGAAAGRASHSRSGRSTRAERRGPRSRARTNHPHPAGVILYTAPRGLGTNVDSALTAPTIRRAKPLSWNAPGAVTTSIRSSRRRPAQRHLPDGPRDPRERGRRARRDPGDLRPSLAQPARASRLRPLRRWFGRIVVNTRRTAMRGRRRRMVRDFPLGRSPKTASRSHRRPARMTADRRGRPPGARARPPLCADRTLLALHHFDHCRSTRSARGSACRPDLNSRLFSARRSLERALEVEQR